MAERPGTSEPIKVATPSIRVARLALRQHGLDLDFDAWLTDRRQAGRTWRQIEVELATITGGQAQISYETLRLHYRDTNPPAPEARAS